MRKLYTPRGYHDLVLDFLTSVERGNLWSFMGSGKTMMYLTLLDALYNVCGASNPTLVLAPKRVAATTWPEEAAKWEHLGDLHVSAVVGTVQERIAALGRSAQVYTINYDNLPWLRDYFKSRSCAWPFHRVVPDESTRLKSFRTRQGGVRAAALAGIAHTNVAAWTNLTGTPSPNGLLDLWGQQWFVDAGKRLGRTYSAYCERWFRMEKGDGYVTFTAKDFAQRQISEALADCTLAIDPRDWFDLREPVVTVVPVDLPAPARKLYNKMERDYFIEIEGSQVDAANAAVKSLKLLQLANGAIYENEDQTDDGSKLARSGGRGGVQAVPRTIEVHDAKLQALESIIAEAAGAPVLVAYHFKSDLRRLQRAFPGGRTLDERDSIAAWNAGKLPLLFAHPASAGHGLNLQDGGNIIVFFGNWWNNEEHDQIIERIGPVRQLQSGHDRNVFIYYIVTRDTVDEPVVESHKIKGGVQNAVREYARRRRPALGMAA